jgi:hypothetical protein
MGEGHYVSTILRPVETPSAEDMLEENTDPVPEKYEWVCYNDNAVSIMDPSEISGAPTAYVLFYVRKDIRDKSIEELFDINVVNPSSASGSQSVSRNLKSMLADNRNGPLTTSKRLVGGGRGLGSGRLTPIKSNPNRVESQKSSPIHGDDNHTATESLDTDDEEVATDEQQTTPTKGSSLKLPAPRAKNSQTLSQRTEKGIVSNNPVEVSDGTVVDTNSKKVKCIIQ